MNKQTITKYAVAVVLGLGVVLGVSSLQAAWTTPAGAPPGSNVDAPVNVGLTSQSKLGQLFINTDVSNPFSVGLSVFGKAIFNGGVQILSGAGANKILTSDANGNASWQSPASSNPAGDEAAFCNYVDTGTTGVSFVGVKSLSLMKGSKNMCTDGTGCIWRAYSFNSSGDFQGRAQDSQNLFIQNSANGNWSEEDDNGTNGNSTSDKINTNSGFGFYDDMTLSSAQGMLSSVITANVEVETSTSSISVFDQSNTTSYKASICDF